MLRQKGLNTRLSVHKKIPIMVEQNKVIYVTHIAHGLHLVLTEFVQCIQVHIGEELTTEIANGQPKVFICIKQALVLRDQIKQRRPTIDDGVTYRVMEQDLFGKPQRVIFRNLARQQIKKSWLVYRNKEIRQIQF